MARNGKSMKMIDFGSTIPEQVNVVVDLATNLAPGQWPDVDGHYAQRPNKKDVIGYLLYKGCMAKLEELGITELAIRTVEGMTGEKFNPNLYVNPHQESEEIKEQIPSPILGGIKAEQSES